MRYGAMALVALIGGQSLCLAGEQFRCGQWVVSQDISVAELLKKCGGPTTRTASTQDDGYMVRTGTTTTEIWTHDRHYRRWSHREHARQVVRDFHVRL